MKKILLIIFLNLIFSLVFAQQHSYRIEFYDPAKYDLTLKTSNLGEKEYQTKNVKLNQLFSKHKVSRLRKAFPSAEKFDHPKARKLAKIYYILSEKKGLSANSDFLNSGQIKKIEPMNNEVTTFLTPDDYDLIPFGAHSLKELDLIRAKEAWDISTGNPLINIAIVDNGIVNDQHEDLTGKITYFGPNTTSSNPQNSSHPHHVAGVAGANTDNGVGLASISFNTKLMIYNLDGSALLGYDQIMDASSRGAKVINCSWGTASYTQDYQDCVDIATANGSIVVAAAGNNNNPLFSGDGNQDGIPDRMENAYPASLNNVISVSSVDVNDNYYEGNDTSGNEIKNHAFNDSVDITAPGWDINLLDYDDGKYIATDGTSFATPMVAGTIALMVDVKPCLDYYGVEYILRQTSDKSVNDLTLHPENAPFVNHSGAGRLDAFEAVLFSQNYPQSILSKASISGTSSMCTSEAVFILENAPNTTITWDRSSNLDYVSGQGTTAYVVEGTSDTSGDWGWIEATVSGACGSVTLPKKNIWVGAPEQAWNTDFYVQGSNGVNPVTLYAESLYTFQIDPTDGAMLYDWILPAGFSFLSSYCPGHKCNTAKIWTSAQNGSYQVKVYPRNSCGSTGTGSQTLTVNVIGGSSGGPSGGGGSGGNCVDPPCSTPVALGSSIPSFSFYPNPVDKVLHISLYEDDSDKENNKEVEITLISNTQEVVYSKNTKAQHLAIPTKHITEGTYFLHIIYPNFERREQIIIVHD